MLEVIEELKERDKNRRKQYLCRCSCGKEIVVSAHNLRSGRSTSCGCSRRKKKVVTTNIDESVTTKSNVIETAIESHVGVTNKTRRSYEDKAEARRKAQEVLNDKDLTKAMILFNKELHLTIEEAIERIRNEG